ncbi:hypothetical protein [Chitinimonas sp.]|uniref:hypothetical protein n=1 Tax=Chitinimonas sp. TaxID=1934313 RepID=UPI0035B1C756
MNRIVGILLALLVAAAVRTCMNKGFAVSPEASAKQAIKEAEEINKTLPKMVDKDTRWDKVTVEESQVYFDYTAMVSAVASSDKPELNAEFQKFALTSLCVDSDARRLMAAGFTVVLRVRDTERIELASARVASGDCKR